MKSFEINENPGTKWVNSLVFSFTITKNLHLIFFQDSIVHFEQLLPGRKT